MIELTRLEGSFQFKRARAEDERAVFEGSRFRPVTWQSKVMMGPKGSLPRRKKSLAHMVGGAHIWMQIYKPGHKLSASEVNAQSFDCTPDTQGTIPSPRN